MSLQYIPWPVACSEWGARLTPSKSGGLGANYPWMESFCKCISKICISTAIHVLWRNLAKSAVAKLPKSDLVLLTKNRRRGHVRAPISPSPLADRAQNFVNVFRPWAVHVCRLWSVSAAVCRIYYSAFRWQSQFDNGQMTDGRKNE